MEAVRDHATFLAGLSPDELTALRERGTPRSFDGATALFHEGDDPGQVLALTSGRVKVAVISASGKEVVLGFCGPGELIGERAAFDGSPRSATVTTLEPVEALSLPASGFRAFLEAHPRLLPVMLAAALQGLRHANRMQLEFAALDTLGRVACRLIELCERFGVDDDAGTAIDLPISQEELSGWSGSSREAVVKALHTLRDLGGIETDRRRITVLDRDVLERFASY